MSRRTPVERGPAYWLQQHQQFMAERGTTRGGYLIHYATQASERGCPLNHAGVQQVFDIWKADQAALDKLAAQAARGRWD